MNSATETTAATTATRGRSGENLTRGSIAAALVALGVLWLAYDGGTYGVVARGTAAIAVLWTVAAGVAFGLWPARRLGAAAHAVGWLLAGFAAFTLLSAWWAPSAERAVAAADLAVLYVGVFALVSVLATVVDRRRIGDGLAWGIVLVGALALGSRLFPHAISTGDSTALLPAVQERLNYPLGYWNALGILLALAVPLLLRAAVAGRPVAASLAVAALPGLSAVLYLTASRGAAAAVFVGVLAFLLLGRRRLMASVALAVATLGSAVAVAVLRGHPALVDPPTGGGAPGTEGRDFLVVLLLLCAATGLVFLAMRALLAGRLSPGRTVERALAVALVVVTFAGAVAAHPLRRIHAFRQPHVSGNEVVQSHLLSSSGNGRWQFWSAAVDEFRAHPVAGGGAGSYEPWWAQHGSLPDFVRNAHSLYLEALAELGLVGIALVGGAFLVGLAGGWRRLRADESEDATQVALVAALLAFATAAAGDWIWQLGAVGAIGVAALALVLAGEGTAAARPRRWWRVAAVAAALALVCAEGLPLVAQLRLDRSEAAVRQGDTGSALRAALDARDLEPWAASPYLQLALVTEQAGKLGAARGWIAEALRHDATDWRLWLVASRIEAKQGAVDKAAASLQRATELNPRSELFRP